MAYIPTSSNPLITTSMLQKALYTVLLKSGPANIKKFIKQRYAFRLVMDDIRKKVLAVWGGDEILFEIDFIDIRSAVCLDASKVKEERHRIKIETFSGESYDFYVDIPYQFDPLPFLRSLNYQIDCYRNPQAHKHDGVKGALILGIVIVIIALLLNTCGLV